MSHIVKKGEKYFIKKTNKPVSKEKALEVESKEVESKEEETKEEGSDTNFCPNCGHSLK